MGRLMKNETQKTLQSDGTENKHRPHNEYKWINFIQFDFNKLVSYSWTISSTNDNQSNNIMDKNHTQNHHCKTKQKSKSNYNHYLPPKKKNKDDDTVNASPLHLPITQNTKDNVLEVIQHSSHLPTQHKSKITALPSIQSKTHKNYFSYWKKTCKFELHQ